MLILQDFQNWGLEGQSSPATQFLAGIKAKSSPPPPLDFQTILPLCCVMMHCSFIVCHYGLRTPKRAFFNNNHKCFDQFGQIRPNTVVMSPSRKFPARAELGHFKFRAETELDFFDNSNSKVFWDPEKNVLMEIRGVFMV